MEEVSKEFGVEKSTRLVELINKIRGLEFTNEDVVEFANTIIDYLGYDEKPSFSVKDVNPREWGHYDHEEGIVISQNLVNAIKNKSENFIELVDTITHEMTHFFQDWLSKNNGEDIKQSEDAEARKIIDEYNNYADMLNNENLHEAVKFLNKHQEIHAINLENCSSEWDSFLYNLSFGLYLQNKCEESARSGAIKMTTSLYKKLLEDSNCPEDLKKWIASYQLDELKMKVREEDKKRERYYFDATIAHGRLNMALFGVKDIKNSEMSSEDWKAFYNLMGITIARHSPIDNFNILKATMLKGSGVLTAHILLDMSNRANSKELMFVKEQIFKTMQEESFADPMAFSKVMEYKLLDVDQQFSLAEQFFNQDKIEYFDRMFSEMSWQAMTDEGDMKQKLESLRDRYLDKLDAAVNNFVAKGADNLSYEEAYKLDKLLKTSLSLIIFNGDREDEYTQRNSAIYEKIGEAGFSLDSIINKRFAKELEQNAKKQCSEYHGKNEDNKMTQDELDKEYESALKIEQMKKQQQIKTDIEIKIYGERYAFANWEYAKEEIEKENTSLDNIRNHVVVPEPDVLDFDAELDALQKELGLDVKTQEGAEQSPTIHTVEEDIMGR